MKQVGEVTSK